MSKEPNRNVYVGHRYVPKIMGEWDKTQKYEGLSIVLHEGSSYTSNGHVPAGIDIKNEKFWALTGNYNAQVEQYRQEVYSFDDRITGNKNDLTGHDTRITNNKNELDNHDDRINGNENDLRNHDTRITNNKNELDNHDDRITDNKNDLSEHNTRITNNKNELDDHNKQIENNKMISVNFINEGGRVNDESYDSTPLLQQLDSLVNEYGHVEIVFPPGKYYFKGTYIMSPAVTIKGSSEFESGNNNGKLGYDRGTVFFHVPTFKRNFIELIPVSNIVESYIQSGSIQNIYMVGNDFSDTALQLFNITNGNYANLQILEFDTGINIESNMKTNFNAVSVMYTRKHGLYMSGRMSTTTRFYNCYFGQTVTRTESYPIKLNNDSGMGIDFYSCAVESTYNGIDLGSGNDVNFYDLYTEHVPAEVNSTLPIISMGTTKPSGVNNGNYNFFGGSIAGTNSGTFHPESKIINTGEYIDSVLFTGIKFKRSNKVIKYVPRKGSITFIACSTLQVTNDPVSSNTDGSLTIIGEYDSSSKFKRSNDIDSITQRTPNGSYRIRTRNTVSDSDLTFDTADGKTTLSLDSNNNIKHGFTGDVLNVKNTNIFGQTERPDFTGVPFTNKIASIWAEDVDGVTQLKTRNSLGTVVDVGQYALFTRPTDPYNGQSIYDNNLRQPIWWNNLAKEWQDAMGNPV